MGCMLRIEHKLIHSTKDVDDKFMVDWVQKMHGITVKTREDVFVTHNVTYLALDQEVLLEQVHLTPIDMSFGYSPDHLYGIVWDNIISIEVVGTDPSGSAAKIIADILAYWKASKQNLFQQPSDEDLTAKALEQEREKPNGFSTT